MYLGDRDTASYGKISNRLISSFACLLAILFVAGCGEQNREYKETIYIFGTLVEFVIHDTDEKDARAAVAQIDREFQRMQVDWHAWKPGELTRVNKAISLGQSVRVSPFLLPVIQQAKSLAARSGYLFDPAIGGLIEAWGFHADEKPDGMFPSLSLIRAIVDKRPSMADVTIEQDLISSSNRAVQFDFGGFAKGTALDRATAILRDLNIEHAIVNAGGDLNVLGNAGERPWRVGIRHPVNWGVIASLNLSDGENIYTSGNYYRFREHEGVRYSHIIDPRNGMPVRHIVSASVIHSNGAVADAAATALSVAGPELWYQVAKQMGIKFAVLIDEAGRVYTNPAMLERIEFAEGAPPEVIVSPHL